MPEEDSNTGGSELAPEVQALITKAVEDATTGLKRTNTELKGEKTELSKKFEDMTKQLEVLGGMDVLKQLGNADTIKQMAEMQKRFSADEQGKLLSEGKYDEWFDKRTGSLRKEHENQMKAIQTQLEDAQGKVGKAETALRKKVLETEVSAAAMDAGIEPTAILDVQLRAAQMFSFDAERERSVLKDDDGGLVFGKDGKSPKTVREWLEDQKETSRHWFPPSKGGGADGSGRIKDKTNLEKLDMRAYELERKKQGFKSF